MDSHSPPNPGSGLGSGAGAALPGRFAPAFDARPVSHQYAQLEDPLAFTVPPFLQRGGGKGFTQDPPYNLYYSTDAYAGLQDGDRAGGSGGADGRYDTYKPPQKQQALQHQVHTASHHPDPTAVGSHNHHHLQQSPEFSLPDSFCAGRPTTTTYAPSPGPPPQTKTNPPPPPPVLPPPRTRDENGVPFYTSAGFNMLAILAQVVNRPAPQIDLGAVDLSCAFCVVDVRERDQPIVYASPMFLLLTGYTESEVVGRNCRFLQSPDGAVAAGEERKWTGGHEVYAMKHHLTAGREIQVELVNYRKGGQRFLNLVTVVPVPDPKTQESDAFLVGFQVDLAEAPSAAMRKLRGGSYLGDYNTRGLPPALLTSSDTYAISRELPAVLGGGNGAATQAKINALLLEHNSDFIHVASLQGAYLYVSPSITRALGHDARALIGKSLMDLTHPADRVPLERELKDAGVAPLCTVRLLYRMRVGPAYPTAASAPEPKYVWVESAGRLRLEAGKGRKAIVMCARRVRVPPRPHGGLRACAVLDAAGAVLVAAPAGALPPPGAHFADAAAPPGDGLLRRAIAQAAGAGARSVGTLTVGILPAHGGGRKKIVLKAREGRILAEVRDEGLDPPGYGSGGGVLEEMAEAHARSWQVALNHLKQQNAALRERLTAGQQRARAPNAGGSGRLSSSRGKRAYD